jgi:hypothetical protein
MDGFASMTIDGAWLVLGPFSGFYFRIRDPVSLVDVEVCMVLSLCTESRILLTTPALAPSETITLFLAPITMAKFSACALGALLVGAVTMVNVDAFAGMNQRKSLTSLKMVSC